MTDTMNMPQEMIDAVMKVPVGLDEDGAEVFPGPFAAAELVRVALAAAPKAEPVSSTDALVDGFAAALKDKLNKAAAKYGFSDDWTKTDWRDELVAQLLQHVTKGDPRDVAAYCAFAWHHGWSLTPEAQKVEQEPCATCGGRGHLMWEGGDSAKSVTEYEDCPTCSQPEAQKVDWRRVKGDSDLLSLGERTLEAPPGWTIEPIYTAPPALLEDLEMAEYVLKRVQAEGSDAHLVKDAGVALEAIAKHKGPQS